MKVTNRAWAGRRPSRTSAVARAFSAALSASETVPGSRSSAARVGSASTGAAAALRAWARAISAMGRGWVNFVFTPRRAFSVLLAYQPGRAATRVSQASASATPVIGAVWAR